MKHTLRIAVVAISAAAGLLSPNWSDQNGLSLTVGRADAATRVYIYGTNPYYTAIGLPWYAVRAYYFGGPWSGPGYSYAGWADYASRNGIACVPGTAVKGGDGILYRCQ